MRTVSVLFLSMILFISSLSMSIAHAEKPIDSGKNQTKQINKAYTPPPGDAERKAILDALRKRWPSDTDTIFVIKYLRVNNGWAWIHVLPKSRDGKNQGEDELWLLQKINGQWKEMESREAGSDCEENPDCSDDQRYYKKLKSKYPSAPANIFPY